MLPAPASQLPRHLVRGARVLESRIALLEVLPRGCVIAEVGVGLGGFSRPLLEACAPARFYAIDSFRLHELTELWGQPPAAFFGAQTQRGLYEDTFRADLQSGVMTILEGDSAAQMELLPDASIDVFYLDADHRLGGITKDLDVAIRKIKPDGWIVINDYIMVDQLGAAVPYGVVYATNDFMIRHDWAMTYFALQTNMFCDVVLRAAGVAAAIEASADAVRGELHAARNEIAMLRRSTSWRVSAPLRAAKRLLAGPGG